MDDLDLGSTIKGFTPGQKVFARYTLKKILGRGGMGVVWLARDEELERAVALKFLPEAVAMDGEAVTDLKRETRRNLQLTHANIVRVHDFLQDARSAAISMEHVDGASLSALKTGEGNGVFPVDRLDPLVAQLCAALEYAHGTARIVHRDLKPANLLLATTGILKVTDFGIARSVADSIDRISAQAGGSSGTPAYMSPQQMLGGEPAVTDDIYAVGATLYDLLTGKPPFHSGNIGQQVQSRIAPRLNERRRELGLAPVPTAWEETIAACLAKLPASRPQSAAELLHRLRGSPSASVAASGPSAASPHRPSGRASRGPALGLAAVVLFGGLIAGGWFFGFGGSSGPVDAPERPAAKTPGRLAGPLRAQGVSYPEDVGIILLGRRLVPSDFEPGGAQVGLLHAAAWTDLYRRDPGIIGQTIEVPNVGGVLVVGIFEPFEGQARADVVVAQRARPASASAVRRPDQTDSQRANSTGFHHGRT